MGVRPDLLDTSLLEPSSSKFRAARRAVCGENSGKVNIKDNLLLVFTRHPSLSSSDKNSRRSGVLG